jgi:hypothetical protein
MNDEHEICPQQHPCIIEWSGMPTKSWYLPMHNLHMAVSWYMEAKIYLECFVMEPFKKITMAGLQINIWRDRTFVRSLLILVGHNLNLVGQKPTPLNLVGHIYVTRYIYISHETSMYSHSGATLSKMLECLVNVIAKCKLSKFAIVFCHSKKMYNVTTFFCDLTNVRSKLLLLVHLPNLVGHCPMSDSNLQPCNGIPILPQPVNVLSHKPHP